ncbi:MAG TPA: hypothetical protein VFY87_19300, partial [Geminicoccaceae bacterium]|nr:hypothetical protein [Geminicoccaceae bacterium]
MRGAGAIVVAAMAGVALAGGARAPRAEAQPGETRAVGTAVSGVLLLAGKQVPLPEGPWVVAGVGHERWAGDVTGAYGAIVNLVLFRLERLAVDAVLELNANELPVADGWGLAADCGRRDLALAVVRYRSGWDGSCFFVTHTLAVTPRPSGAWEQALGFAAEADLIMAPLWLTAGFRVANRRDVVDARFHFSPTMRGIPVEIVSCWSDSAWHGERLSHDPARSALGSAVARWATFYSGLLEGGLKNRLADDSSLPMPGAPAMAAQGGVLENRLAALEEQRRAGVVGERQFRRQVRWLGEHGIRPGSEAVDPSTAAMFKSLTFRPLAAAGSLAMGLVGIGAGPVTA